MRLGTWGNQITAANYQSKMLCFKFGSVVGMDLNTGAFTTANIKFNPMTTPASVTNWATVPLYANADYTAGVTNISASNWHNVANMKAGKGDPCKLVGLTVEQIRAGSIDNGEYRLPTNADNQSFVGSASTQDTGSAYYSWTTNGSNATNPGVGTILLGTAKGARLPALGVREEGMYFQGTHGYYLSSMSSSSTNRYCLFANPTGVTPAAEHANYASLAFAVRCVPQS
jgi:hypothetical protein